MFRSSFVPICGLIGLLAGFLVSYVIRPTGEVLTLVEWYSVALLERSSLSIVIICTLLGGAASMAVGLALRSVNRSSLLPPPNDASTMGPQP
jgi:hypothetical protein